MDLRLHGHFNDPSQLLIDKKVYLVLLTSSQQQSLPQKAGKKKEKNNIHIVAMHIENKRSKDNDPITNSTNSRESESLTQEELIDLVQKSNDQIDAIITNASDQLSAVFSPTTYQTEVGRKQGKGESSTTTENNSIQNITQNLRHK